MENDELCFLGTSPQADMHTIAASIGPVKAQLATARQHLWADLEPPVRPAPGWEVEISAIICSVGREPMDSQEYDEIIRQLVQIAAHQGTINADLREFNRQQVEINADTKTTLARIETLLARMLRHEDNGRDA